MGIRVNPLKKFVHHSYFHRCLLARVGGDKMFRIIEETKNLIEKENLQESYSELYSVLSKMIKSRELDEESNKLNTEINEYLKNEKKEK